MKCLRLVLAIGLLSLACGRAATPTPPSASGREEGDWRYFDLTSLGLEGQGWSDTDGPYDRLPARAQALVPPAVWGLSRHSAGLCARFVTDASEIKVRWILTSAHLAMPHMPATGVSGVDLYVRLPSGTWRWLANGRPAAQTNEVRLCQDLPPAPREFCLYLPLYNGVSSAEVALPRDATLTPAPPRPASRAQPLVFYGTSITQGGCASRPGMVHTALIGRALDQPVINLGFSGNGKMEPALAQLLAELNPAVFILDCLPNMDAAMVQERLEPFVLRLRQSHPLTPILLVEDRTYADSFLNADRARRNQENRAALQQTLARLQTQGVANLHCLKGTTLLGTDGEDTVDGSHPTDLGFVRQADAFLAALREILHHPQPGGSP